MYKLRLALVLAAAILTGCGGGGGAGGGPDQPARVVPVALYGDSTQGGYADGTSPAKYAGEILTGRATLANHGVGGNTSRMMLDGTDGKNLAWSQEMARSSAEIVTIKVAINDSAMTTAAFKLNIEEMVSIARAHRKFVILETPSPVDPAVYGAVWTNALNDRVSVLKDVSVQHAVYLCVHPAVPLADGIHPTVEGYKLVGQNLARCLGDVL